MAVLDPHGDLIDQVLERVPAERVADVVLFDPSDASHPIPFNILHAHSEVEKNLMASDLGAIFRRLSTSWGDQMTAVLGNAILAFLESDRGGTLVDLRQFLVDKAFRAEFLASVRDPEVRFFWEREYPRLSGRPEAPVLTRLNTFLRPKLVRNMVAQRENRIDFASLMDTGKVFLGKLSAGLIGEENAHLLGSLLVSKFHQLAIGRQQREAGSRRPFYLYVDEFHHFVTPSMASILSGARKYGLGLVLAHQDLAQLARTQEIGSAALVNAYTRVCFRLGDADARRMADGFSFFTAQELQSLAAGEAIARVEQAAFDFNLRTRPLLEIDPDRARARRVEIRAHSRSVYAVPVEDSAVVPETIREAFPPPLPPKPTAPKASMRPPSTTRAARPLPPTSPGRGGPQHKYLQQLVKRLAEERGCRARVEHELVGGGRVDIAIDAGERRVACEISVTSTPDQELRNVRKCLEAGFDPVIVLCPDGRRLREIQKRVRSAPELASGERVWVLAADEFALQLDALLAPAGAREETIRGYRVRVTQAPGDVAGAKGRREAIARVIAESLKRVRDD